MNLFVGITFGMVAAAIGSQIDAIDHVSHLIGFNIDFPNPLDEDKNKKAELLGVRVIRTKQGAFKPRVTQLRWRRASLKIYFKISISASLHHPATTEADEGLSVLFFRNTVTCFLSKVFGNRDLIPDFKYRESDKISK